MPYDKALGTFFIRCRIKISHQPLLSYLLILLSFLVLSLILGGIKEVALYVTINRIMKKTLVSSNGYPL
ncbi:MAG TPA: hypothetical protein HPP56_00665 [Nitrospirae bacterium]|nr:hypothetical protein [Nitrospirota bacterium]